MEESKVVDAPLVVAHEDRSALGQPTDRALHHPAARLAAATVAFLLADAPDVRHIALPFSRGTSSLGVIRLVQTQILLDLIRIRALCDDGVDGRLEQLRVVDIRACDDYAEWAAVTFDDDAALGTGLRPIRRVRTDMIPGKRAFDIAPSALCQRHWTIPSSSACPTRRSQIRSMTPRSHQC